MALLTLQRRASSLSPSTCTDPETAASGMHHRRAGRGRTNVLAQCVSSRSQEVVGFGGSCCSKTVVAPRPARRCVYGAHSRHQAGGGRSHGKDGHDMAIRRTFVLRSTHSLQLSVGLFRLCFFFGGVLSMGPFLVSVSGPAVELMAAASTCLSLQESLSSLLFSSVWGTRPATGADANQ